MFGYFLFREIFVSLILNLINQISEFRTFFMINLDIVTFQILISLAVTRPYTNQNLYLCKCQLHLNKFNFSRSIILPYRTQTVRGLVGLLHCGRVLHALLPLEDAALWRGNGHGHQGKENKKGPLHHCVLR